MTDRLPSVEAVARDLTHLIAYGATPRRAAQRPSLRSLPQLGDNPAGDDIVDELWAATGDLDETYEYVWAESRINADKIYRAFWILLDPDSLGRPNMRNIEPRRIEALKVLGAEHITEWQWSHRGAALALMRILAQRLIERGIDYHSGVSAQTAELTYHFSPTGGWVKVDVVRSLVPRKSGHLTTYEYNQELVDWLHLHSNASHARPLFGCTVDAPSNAQLVKSAAACINLSNLTSGQPCYFGYSIDLADRLPHPNSYGGHMNPPAIWFRPRTQFREVTIRQVYTDSWHPFFIWKFSDLLDLTILSNHEIEGTYVGSDEHTFTARFSNPAAHLYHGVGRDFRGGSALWRGKHT